VQVKGVDSVDPFDGLRATMKLFDRRGQGRQPAG
jgi:hypothetical protein